MRTRVELEDTEKHFRPPYAKIKLDLAYNDDSPAFKVFEEKDGVRTEVVLNSFTEPLLFIRYMTKHRMVISFSKLYAMKTLRMRKEVRDRLESDRDRVLEQDRPEVEPIH